MNTEPKKTLFWSNSMYSCLLEMCDRSKGGILAKGNFPLQVLIETAEVIK